MTVNLNGIDIQIVRKRIKNIHLSVRHIDGKVTLSVPFSLSNKVINDFLQSKLTWIEKQFINQESKPKLLNREYITGEIIYVFGTPYTLVVKDINAKSTVFIEDNNLMLFCKKDSTAEMRKKHIDELSKKLLYDKILIYMEKWENITDFKCKCWQIRDMKTRWGTYSQKTDKIWLNLQLTSKPFECIEYVVLHELAHTKVLNHGKDFVAIMDKFMPNWKQVKKALNSQTEQYLN